MGERIRKLKKIRIHHEGTNTLLFSLIAILFVAVVLWCFVDNKWAFWSFVAIFGTVSLCLISIAVLSDISVEIRSGWS